MEALPLGRRNKALWIFDSENTTQKLVDIWVGQGIEAEHLGRLRWATPV